MNAPTKPETIRIGDRDIPLRDTWATPQWLVDRLRARWGFDLDAAATRRSRIIDGSGEWIGPDHPDVDRRDALTAEWCHMWAAFVNPPFSKSCGGLSRWVEAFIRESKRAPVVAVLPDTPSCKWFRRAWDTAAEVTLFDGRVAFDPPVGVQSSSPRGGVVVFAWVPRIAGPARVRWESVPGREVAR
jgi:phage N-6-adenine-methyltransferase